MTRAIEGLDAKIREFSKDRAPSNPPSVILLGLVGDVLAENINTLSEAAKVKIFTAIESEMASSDAELRQGIATGLIEALISKADMQPDFDLELGRYFGPLSANTPMLGKPLVRNDQKVRQYSPPCFIPAYGSRMCISSS